MKVVTRTMGGFIVVLLFGCARFGATGSEQTRVAEEYVGTTPCDREVRTFLGGISSTTACHAISWRLTLLTNQDARLPKACKIAAVYQVPTRSNPNQSEEGPKVAWRGTWEISKGWKSNPAAVVYHVRSENPERSISLVKMDDGLLHLMKSSDRLMCGDGGESFTLNRSDHVEKPRDLTMAAPSISYTISRRAEGPQVFGIFEGRTPCQGISRELKRPENAGCFKAKWRVTLLKNPETGEPTTYKIEGSLFRQSPREGTWTILRGTPADPNAVVYRLDATPTEPALYLWEGDRNVLFFLDQNRKPMLGNAEFSYTLSRTDGC
jgi:hypothetical protein